MAPGSYHRGRSGSLTGSAPALARIEPPGTVPTSHPGSCVCAWCSRQRLLGDLFSAPYRLRLDGGNGFYSDGDCLDCLNRFCHDCNFTAGHRATSRMDDSQLCTDVWLRHVSNLHRRATGSGRRYDARANDRRELVQLVGSAFDYGMVDPGSEGLSSFVFSQGRRSAAKREPNTKAKGNRRGRQLGQSLSRISSISPTCDHWPSAFFSSFFASPFFPPN